MTYARTFGDEVRGRMLDVSFYLRSWLFGVQWGPIDYTGNEDDWHLRAHLGPLAVQYTRLGDAPLRDV